MSLSEIGTLVLDNVELDEFESCCCIFGVRDGGIFDEGMLESMEEGNGDDITELSDGTPPDIFCGADNAGNIDPPLLLLPILFGKELFGILLAIGIDTLLSLGIPDGEEHGRWPPIELGTGECELGIWFILELGMFELKLCPYPTWFT